MKLIRLLVALFLSVLLPATLVSVRPFLMPEPPIGTGLMVGGTILANGGPIALTGDRWAVCLYPPKAGDVQRVAFLTGAVTINAASVVRVSLQDLGATTGDPDATQDQTADISGAGVTANAWITSGNLSTNRTVAVTTQFCVVFEYQTFTTGDTVAFRALNMVSGSQRWVQHNYADFYTVAAWTKSIIQAPCIALEYSDGTYAYTTNLYPVLTAVNSAVFNTGTTPDEIGLSFQLPFKSRVTGVWFAADLDGNTDVVLYGPSTVTVSTNLYFRSSGSTKPSVVYFTTPQTLLAATVYRVALLPTTVTSITVPYISVFAAALMGAMPGGANMYWTQRTDAGAWSDTTTQVPMIGLVIDQVDDGTGSGTGAAMPTVISH